MLRLRATSFALVLVASFSAVAACRGEPDPAPLAEYGSERLMIARSHDVLGTPIVYAYLFPHHVDECPPLADVKASIDGRTLAVNSGGGSDRPCFGPSFKAPLVVLTSGVDFHDLTIEDHTKTIRMRVADLRSDARLSPVQDGDALRLRFDHAFRGRITEAAVTWSGAVPGDVVIDGDTIVAPIPKVVDRSGRIVVAADAMIALEISACEGIADCEATWFFHEVLDVSLNR